MSRLTWIARKVLGTVGGRTLTVLVLLIVIYQAWLSVTAATKVADDVGANPDSRGRFAVDVVLGFPPERFHVLQLQDYGRIRGTEGNVLHLRAVTQADIDEMARKYWIKQILPGES